MVTVVLGNRQELRRLGQGIRDDIGSCGDESAWGGARGR